MIKYKFGLLCAACLAAGILEASAPAQAEEGWPQQNSSGADSTFIENGHTAGIDDIQFFECPSPSGINSPTARYLDLPPVDNSYRSYQTGSFMNPDSRTYVLTPEQKKRTLKLQGFRGSFGQFYTAENSSRFTAMSDNGDGTDSADQSGFEYSTAGVNGAEFDDSRSTAEIIEEARRRESLGRAEDSTVIQDGSPVHLIADKVSVEGDTIVAEGSAAIDVMGARLMCSRLVMDRLTGKITASGECVIYWNNNFAAADWMTYDPNGQVAVLHNVTGQGRDFSTSDSALDSDILFWADTMQWTKDKMSLTDAVFTTCDNTFDKLDYKFVTKYAEIYPQDKLVASNTGVYIHNKRLYTMPTLNVPLDNKRRARQTVIPQIGTNSVDGWFARSTIDYVFDNNNYGEVMLDYYNKTGIGTGIHHYYTLGKKGSGDLYYYRINGDKINTRYDLSSNVSYHFDDETEVSWEFSSNKSETPGFTHEGRVNSLFSFKHQDEKNDLRFSHNYNTKGSDNRNTTWRMYYDLQLTPELSTMWKAELSTISTAFRTADRFHYEGGLRHTGELFDCALSIENTNGDTNYSLNRNPEFTIRSHPIFIGDVPILVSAGLGYVTESPSMYSTGRSDLRLQIPEQSFEYDSGRFLAGAGFRQLFYGNGQSMYSLAARLGWMQEIGDCGTIRIDYNWLSPNGETPLQYDHTTGYENLTGGVEFFKDDVFNIAVVGGYNLRNNRMQNITPRIRFRPGEDWLISAGSSYDPYTHKWRSLDTNLRMQLGKEFAISHWSVYDFVNNRFTYQDYQLDYEAHDWITSLVYRSVQNELYFQFSLKALPQPSVTIGPNPADNIVPKNRRNAFVQ